MGQNLASFLSLWHERANLRRRLWPDRLEGVVNVVWLLCMRQTVRVFYAKREKHDLFRCFESNGPVINYFRHSLLLGL